MAKNSLTRLLEHLRMVAAVHAYRDLADGELLERFVKGSDESAFTVLIERPGRQAGSREITRNTRAKSRKR